MHDITPRPPRPVVKPEEPLLEAPAVEALLSAPEPLLALEEKTPRKPRRRRVWVVSALSALVIIIAATLLVWYNIGLSAKGGSLGQLVVVKVPAGSTPTDIGRILQEEAVIRDALVFDIYTRLSGTKDNLQAGTYRLSPAETVQQIVGHLVNGNVDEFSITFLPGATLAENRKVLINAGYSVTEVDTALAATYDSPLFAGKPASSDLEGYIYGETYNFNSGATVSEILQRTFTEYEAVVAKNNLVEGYKKQGLSLFEGITLASIIQREVNGIVDQRQVAQVFYTRLASGMQLGSDVTYMYAAKKLGVVATPSLDSPYNTRNRVGLPPGPIAVPGLSALQAAATPASGTYVYFLSGDDDLTYFARTNAEHEANIVAHCKVKCSQ
jgi:UPF0755 protein